MAGAGYKLFNTGDVLTAQQVNEYLMQQTTMVFADASARTTALSGVLAEGMMSYLQDTNSTEVYNGSAWVALAADQTPLTTKGDLFTYTTADARLAVGTNGQYLKANSSTATGLEWASISTGGMTLLSTTTLSGATTTVSSIDQTYQSLLVFISRATWSSGNGTVYIKPNASNNICSFIGTYWQAGAAGTSGSSDTDIQTYLNTTSSSGLGFAAVRFYRYADTSDWKVYDGSGGGTGSGGSGMAYVYGGTVKTNSAISSLLFYPSSGANFSGGTVLIYGVK